jgi:hypothetical protein
MSAPLDYARPTPYPATLAVQAMLCGLLSGPAGLLFAFSAPNGFFALLALCISLGIAFIFSMLVLFGLPKPSRRRDLVFSIIGVAAPVVWVLLGFVAFKIAVSVAY